MATGDFTALITLNGEIGVDSEVSAINIKSSLKEAYENPGTKALILAIKGQITAASKRLQSSV